MNRAEIEAHPGFNVVIAKLYESHDGLREILRTLERMAGELAPLVGQPPGEAWVRTAARYGAMFQEIMHAHHGTEDENIFPYLTGWFDFDSAALDREHAELNRQMPGFAQALAPLLEPKPLTTEAVATFAEAARNMRALVDAHFDHEERTVTVALLVLTEEDIQRMFLGQPVT